MNDRRTIGFIGAGKMATALSMGFLKQGLSSAAEMLAFDVHAPACNSFHESTGIACTNNLGELVDKSKVLVLAVKPQQIVDVCDVIGPDLHPHHLVVSIAAGITVKQLSDVLPGHQRIIRVMPNTPCLVGMGASAFTTGDYVVEEDRLWVKKYLSSVGIVYEVPEYQLDAVTGLSGSGPAFVMQFIEALSDAGVKMGLSRIIATELALYTVMGSAKWMQETGLHPAVLKDQVTSPGGTTIAGLHELERGGLRAAVMNAVESATLRSQELAKK
jgi:pyrroline-5-carboxylate reductase